MSRRVVGYWIGFITGAVRGRIRVRLRERGKSIAARALIEEQPFGPAYAEFRGELNGNDLTFRLLNYESLAPYPPLGGQFQLAIQDDPSIAHGTWQTDLGTAGKIFLNRLDRPDRFWWFRYGLHLTRYHCRRKAALIYVLLLISIAVGAILRPFQVPYSVLIILLLPVPYLFRSQLLELFYAFRIRRLGPLEVEPQTLPDATAIHDLVDRRVEERVYFLILDGFFVQRTKLLLLWLAQNRQVPREQFDQQAQTLGIQADNIEVTLQALVTANCAELADGRVQLTELGSRYAGHLLRRFPS